MDLALIQERKRFLEPTELLAAQVVPTTDLQASMCQAPKLNLSGVKRASICKMAGNGMSVPCIGFMLLAAICSLKPIPVP